MVLAGVIDENIRELCPAFGFKLLQKKKDLLVNSYQKMVVAHNLWLNSDGILFILSRVKVLNVPYNIYCTCKTAVILHFAWRIISSLQALNKRKLKLIDFELRHCYKLKC